MAQTSLTKRNLHFNNPENAKAAKAKSKPRAGSAPEYAALRRQQIIDLKVKGWTNQQIADHFGLSLITIKRDVAIIRRDGLIHKWENRIVGALMKKAVDKIGRALDKDDDSLEAVEMVFKRFDSLSQRKHEAEIAESRSDEDDSLSGWVKNWLAAKAAESAPPPDAIDTELAGPLSDSSEQVFHERPEAAQHHSGSGDFCNAGPSATQFGKSHDTDVVSPEPAAESDPATGQASADSERPGGPESSECPEAPETSPSADPSQGGLAFGEAEGVGPSE